MVGVHKAYMMLNMHAPMQTAEYEAGQGTRPSHYSAGTMLSVQVLLGVHGRLGAQVQFGAATRDVQDVQPLLGAQCIMHKLAYMHE